MPFELRVTGTEKLAETGKALRQAGLQGKGLRRELYKSVNRATKPLKQEAKAEARKVLPKRGKLNQLVSRSNLSTKTKLTGSQVGVKITAKKTEHIDRIDQGSVRHPLFGNRRHWYGQKVREGWFTRPMERGATRTGREILKAVDKTIKQIEKG
jgi:hypothetical protein